VKVRGMPEGARLVRTDPPEVLVRAR
jgi:hypothetical protein